MTYRYFQSRTLSYCMWGRFISRYKETDTVATVAEADKNSDSFSMIQMQIGTDHVATVAEADRNRPFCYDSDAYAEADRNSPFCYDSDEDAEADRNSPFCYDSDEDAEADRNSSFAIIQMQMQRREQALLL